jgi:hypothetical protein
MSFVKHIAQEVQELGMKKLGNSNAYFVNWENDERFATIMMNADMNCYWEVEWTNLDDKYAPQKIYYGEADSPFDALDALNECISESALGLTIEVGP